MTQIRTNLFWPPPPPPKLKGSPLTMKPLNFFQNVDFDSSKEASWGTKCNTKNHRTLPSMVTDKIKKEHQNALKTCNFEEKNGIFGSFFFIFLVTVYGKDQWFYALRSVTQGASFELLKSTLRKKSWFFHHKGGLFLFRWGQNKLVWICVILPRKILRENALQKQSAQHSSSYLVYMASVIHPLWHFGY